ncbi:sensor histidine kinase [Heliophilum fasciatum]|uniref:histidine kinase n=1 Tax=Heliophilum fasciatum TaxID=35700 RepID=A0A4R2RIL0_9FIRM|nr:ATP-binding protein [Heliophilum fasciatum]MCW2278624.1 signal transduction histidine kinase [Heliophilum fasciatum]TCP62674.1 phospho-acceptor domain-containing protein [Heliophilum fasciatum]
MFTQIRKRLTLLYMGFMALFLLAFGGISFGWLSSMIYQDQKREITTMVQEETGLFHRLEARGRVTVPASSGSEANGAARDVGGDDHDDDEHEDDNNDDDEDKSSSLMSAGVAMADGIGNALQALAGINGDGASKGRGGKPEGLNGAPLLRVLSDNRKERPDHEWERRLASGFSYVIGPDGQLLAGRESLPELRSMLLAELADWHPKQLEERWITLERPEVGDVKMLVLAQPLRHGDRTGVTVLAGKDVGFYQHVLVRLLAVLTATGLTFLAVAAGAGYFLAGRAMVPIKEAFQRQKAFVADASHELRTPLSVIQSSIEVVEAEEADRLSLFSQQVLADLRDEVGRMTRLISDLLTLARADTEAGAMKFASMDMAAIVAQVVRRFRPAAEKAGIQLMLWGSPVQDEREYAAMNDTTDETGGPAHIPMMLWGDKERLTQLLYILLDNAIKYTPEGGQVQVNLVAQKQGIQERALLTVKDSGIGIAPEQQAHVFERFYRVDKARSRESGGTGLGLAIAHWIVTAHQGTIGLESTLNEGTTFQVCLPMGKHGKEKPTGFDV